VFIFYFYQGYRYRLLVDTKFYLLIQANINLDSADLAVDEISKMLDIQREIVLTKMRDKQQNE